MLTGFWWLWSTALLSLEGISKSVVWKLIVLFKHEHFLCFVLVMFPSSILHGLGNIFIVIVPSGLVVFSLVLFMFCYSHISQFMTFFALHKIIESSRLEDLWDHPIINPVPSLSPLSHICKCQIQMCLEHFLQWISVLNNACLTHIFKCSTKIGQKNTFCKKKKNPTKKIKTIIQTLIFFSK